MIYWNIKHGSMQLWSIQIYKFSDDNPRSGKSKDIFCDNWIQGWISLAWEIQNFNIVLFPQKPWSHQLQKTQKLKHEFRQISYLRDQGTRQRICPRWTFVRQQSRERKQKERWSTEGLIHTFQSFFPFCFVFIFWSIDLLVCFFHRLVMLMFSLSFDGKKSEV